MATKTVKLTRQEKAELMFSDGMLVEKTDDGFLVPGAGSNRYLVGVDYDIWHCDCPDFQFRGQGELCKHVLFVQMLETLKASEASKLEELNAHLDIHLKKGRVVV